MDFSRGFVAVDVALRTLVGSLGLVCGGLYCTNRPRREHATPKAEVLASLPMMLWRTLEQFTPLHQRGKERAFDCSTITCCISVSGIQGLGQHHLPSGDTLQRCLGDLC